MQAADKEWIQAKVSAFRAAHGQRTDKDNVAEPTGEEPQAPSNSPDASGSVGLDGSAAESDGDDGPDMEAQIARVLANVKHLKIK